MMRVIANAIEAEEAARAELDRARSRLQCFAVERRMEIVGRTRGTRPLRDERCALIRFVAAGKAYFAAAERTNRFIVVARRRENRTITRREADMVLLRPVAGLALGKGRR